MSRFTLPMFREYVAGLIAPEQPKTTVATGRSIEMADRLVLITDTGSGRDLMQGMFEAKTYRISTRGRPEDLEDALNLANLVLDKLDYTENVDIDDVRILAIRNRAKPRQIAYTDDQGRYSFVAEYEVKSSKD